MNLDTGCKNRQNVNRAPLGDQTNLMTKDILVARHQVGHEQAGDLRYKQRVKVHRTELRANNPQDTKNAKRVQSQLNKENLHKTTQRCSVKINRYANVLKPVVQVELLRFNDLENVKRTHINKTSAAFNCQCSVDLEVVEDDTVDSVGIKNVASEIAEIKTSHESESQASSLIRAKDWSDDGTDIKSKPQTAGQRLWQDKNTKLPKNIPLPQTNEGTIQTNDTNVKSLTSAQGEQVEKTQKTKRARGRPKKIAENTELHEKEAEGELKEAQDEHVQSQKVKCLPKRSRGWPKKAHDQNNELQKTSPLEADGGSNNKGGTDERILQKIQGRSEKVRDQSVESQSRPVDKLDKGIDTEKARDENVESQKLKCLPKRLRGRPKKAHDQNSELQKKSPLETEGKNGCSIKSQSKPEDKLEGIETEKDVQLPQRGRGRPRKTFARSVELQKDAETLPQPEVELERIRESLKDAQLTQRSRGRPKKTSSGSTELQNEPEKKQDKNLKSKERLKKIHDSVNTKEPEEKTRDKSVESLNDELLPHRDRGRPKKTVFGSINSLETKERLKKKEDDSVKSVEDIQPPQKARGRPKKGLSKNVELFEPKHGLQKNQDRSVESEQSGAPSRSIGRPKKRLSRSVESSPQANRDRRAESQKNSELPQRGRGRPKKTLAASTEQKDVVEEETKKAPDASVVPQQKARGRPKKKPCDESVESQNNAELQINSDLPVRKSKGRPKKKRSQSLELQEHPKVLVTEAESKQNMPHERPESVQDSLYTEDVAFPRGSQTSRKLKTIIDDIIQSAKSQRRRSKSKEDRLWFEKTIEYLKDARFKLQNSGAAHPTENYEDAPLDDQSIIPQTDTLEIEERPKEKNEASPGVAELDDDSALVELKEVLHKVRGRPKKSDLSEEVESPEKTEKRLSFVPLQNKVLPLPSTQEKPKSKHMTNTQSSFKVRGRPKKSQESPLHRSTELHEDTHPQARGKDNLSHGEDITLRMNEQIQNENSWYSPQITRPRPKYFLESSKSESTDTERAKNVSYNAHVPIYLQDTGTKERLNPRDPFEFISYSARKKKGRRRMPKLKVEGSDSDSSSCYDKSMHEVLKKIRQKVITKVKIYSKKPKNVKFAKIQSDDAKKTVNLVPRNVQTNKTPEVSIRKNSVNVQPQTKDSEKFFGFSDDEDEEEEENINNISKVSPVVQSQDLTTVVSQNLGLKKFTSLTSTPLPNMVPNGHLQNKKIHVTSNILLSAPRNRSLQHTEETAQRSPRRVTPQIRRLIQPRPWRSNNVNVTRNPHWLAIKDTSLPSYNQEMILDPKLLEKPVPARTAEPQKEKVQTTMLDYVNASERSPKKINNSSLFDYDNFSPIKVKSADARSPPRSPNKSRRNILDSVGNIDEPSRTFFGFDVQDSVSEKENLIVAKKKYMRKRKVQQDERALPMRVPVAQLKKVREEAVEKLLEENVEDVRPSTTVGEDASDGAQLADEGVQVGLFEDLEEVRPVQRKYRTKQCKRVRLSSMESRSESEDERPKRKRKDFRNRAEEQEFDKWAAAFNAMCDEVEKHSLDMD